MCICACVRHAWYAGQVTRILGFPQLSPYFCCSRLPIIAGGDVRQYERFFYCDESLGTDTEAFADKHSDVIDLTSDENKIEYTSVFNEHNKSFESKLENFITNSVWCSVIRFFEALKGHVTDEPNSRHAMFVQVLLAVTDFDMFLTMMREKAVQLRRKYVMACSHMFIATCLTDVHISLYFSNKSCVDISSMNESIHSFMIMRLNLILIWRYLQTSLDMLALRTVMASCDILPYSNILRSQWLLYWCITLYAFHFHLRNKQ